MGSVKAAHTQDTHTHNLCYTKALSQNLVRGMELLYLTQNDFQQRYHAAKKGYYSKLKLNNNKKLNKNFCYLKQN